MTDTKLSQITVLVLGEKDFQRRVRTELAAARFAGFEVVAVSSIKSAFEVLCARPCDVLLADAGVDPAQELAILSHADRICVVLVVAALAGPSALTCLEAGVQEVLPAGALAAETLERVLCSAVIRFRVAASERELRRGPALDPLTGLYTPQALTWHLKGAVEFARRFGDRPGLVLVAVEDLGPLARRLGKMRADVIVQEVARRLRWSVRQSDFIARVGDLRFAIFVRHVTTEAGLRGLVQRLVAVGNAPVLVHGDEVPIRLRVGAALCAGEESCLQDLVERAARSALGFQPEVEGGASRETAFPPLPPPMPMPPGELQTQHAAW
jgi:diguanylate cyclase (GGDEF)-like protein